MAETDPDRRCDDFGWMKMESIGGYSWRVWALCALMVLISLAVALLSWP